MKKEKKLNSFKNRLDSVFDDDLKYHNWQLKLVEGNENSEHQLTETTFIFSDFDEKMELVITVSLSTSIPLMQLTVKTTDGKQEFGSSIQVAMMQRDKDKLDETNEEIYDQLDEKLRPIVRRIYRYIGLKIDEFLY